MKYFHDIKDKSILTGWIMGLLIVISVIWIVSHKLQGSFLMRAVNNVLMNNDDSRRLSAHIQKKTGKADPLGYWFSIDKSSDKIFIFTVFNDGVLVPLGAIVSDNGKVEEVIPLSAHAVQIFNRIPPGILQIYINRIEKNGL
ncbi:MAG: hypothetical protein LBI12_05710 [Treponema sp.]|jgi:hypothetical protein|nr:hypothetical protein [Treponema sp.]